MIFIGEIKESKRLTSIQLCGLCGILCVIIFFTSLIISVFCSNWFSWTENYISELAGSFGEKPIWSSRGIASIILNGGLILTGALGIIFSILIRKDSMFSSNLGRAGLLILSVDMFALSAVGVFPITLGSLHVLFSVILFSLAPFLLLILGYQMGKLFGKKFWWITSLLSFVSLCSVGVFMYMPGFLGYSKAIAELVVLSSIFVLLIIISIRLLNPRSILLVKS
jgi:hypothetical membrane protein